MTVQQIYQLMNTVTGEVLGKTDLVKEDLSNVVDVGTEVFNASAVDNYVKVLVNVRPDGWLGVRFRAGKDFL